MRRLIPVVLGILLLGGQLYAQNTVSGKVTDSDGSAIPGTTIAVKAGTTGTTTDQNGNYSLVVSPSSVLVFSFIGFETKEVTVGNQTKINVTLVPSVNQLSEVVITAQGIERDKRS